MSCIMNCTTCKTDNKLFLLDAGRLARSRYPEGPVTGHLDTGFSWFPCVLQQMLGWFQILPSCHYMLHM